MSLFIRSTLAFFLCSASVYISAAEWSGHVKWESEVSAVDPTQKGMADILRRVAPSFTYDCAAKQRCITILKMEKDVAAPEIWYANDKTQEFSFISSPLDAETGVLTWQAAQNYDLDSGSDDESAKSARALIKGQRIYSTQLEKIGDGNLIAGLPTTHYRVVKSGFVREGATAEIWVHEAITLPRARWQSEVEDTYFMLPASPIPLSIPLDSGIILKASVTENGVNIIYTATEVIANKANFPQKTE